MPFPKFEKLSAHFFVMYFFPVGDSDSSCKNPFTHSFLNACSQRVGIKIILIKFFF